MRAALALLVMMGAATAQAQSTELPLERAVVYPTPPPPSEALPPPPSLSEAALPEGYGATTRWESAPMAGSHEAPHQLHPNVVPRIVESTDAIVYETVKTTVPAIRRS